MTRVAVIATGGTIASTATRGGVVATRNAEALVESARINDIDVETHDLMTVGSYRMTLGHIRSVSDAVAGLLQRRQDPVDGIVITHGTDTMEETAILLDLVHGDPRPLVLTGAQRASDATDGDGPRNLADAILAAAAPDCRGLGVLIVFAGRVLPARGTRKVHTTALDAFHSVVGGKAGDVSDGTVLIRAVPRRPAPLPRPTARFDGTRVDLIEMYPGADAALLTAAVAAGARGIVLAGTGIGNANPVVVAAVRELVGDDVAVVLSTRVAQGPVEGVYGDGGGADLVAAGVPTASGLPASQLRMLLALWLSENRADAARVRSMIATYADNKEE
ncbi:asparaginase [Mycolicibacterium baixiangningiae]|uniref:asparaginase n=1 Tax=Mycolicibacterium baixiangningiae TaxID=2761578 RepID=UPI0018D1B746|nr:asparaginase [Mycolicibacterium baixiangningiae]